MDYNTMRLGTDLYAANPRRAIMVAGGAHFFNFANCTQLVQFNIWGDEPTNTKRRFLFRYNDKNYKFSGQNASEYTGAITAENVLNNGNTAAEVLAIKNNTWFAGKKIFPIIALESTTDERPTVAINAVATTSVSTLDDSSESGVIAQYDDSGNILPFKLLAFERGQDSISGGSGDVKIKLRYEAGGDWSDYMSLDDATGKIATRAAFLWSYHVNAVNGSNSVKLAPVTTYYSTEPDSKVFGDVAYVYSIRKFCTVAVSNCVLVVRHYSLDGGQIQADVSYQITRATKSDVVLGTATGSEQTFTIPDDFFPNSLKIFASGSEITDFDFNTSNHHVKLTATAGALITANYSYPCQDEVWLPMNGDPSQPTGNGLFTKRFALPNPNSPLKQTVSAIRIKLTRGAGSSSLTKAATGEPQSVKLGSHNVKSKSITCDADIFDFDEETNRLTFTAPAGQTVHISYDWFGDTPKISGWSATWTA